MAKQEIENIYNFLQLSESVATSGQPTKEQLVTIREAGYQLIVNLALTTSTNALENEKELVEAIGIKYIHIPVVWEKPTLMDLKEFFKVMNSNSKQNIFVHCAANMRVSAFIYLYRLIQENYSEIEAKKDLNKIWFPNPIWQKFIEEAITHREEISSSSNL